MLQLMIFAGNFSFYCPSLSRCRFTPSVEVALCGHATLAAAHVLFEHSYLNLSSPSGQMIDTICFNTLHRGQLRAKRVIQNGSIFIELNFPSQPPLPHQFSDLEMSSLCRGLGIDSNDILFSGKSIDDALLVVSPETFTKIPSLASGLLDINAIASIESRGVIVTCVGPTSSHTSPFAETFPEADFLSRFFGPK
jgi:predicted PhzF superfamily epimerase YddE/YHI9